MASTKTMLISGATSAAAAVIFLREFMPPSVQNYVVDLVTGLFARLSSELTVVVDESRGFSSNRMYKAVETYLATKLPPSTRRLRVAVDEDDSDELTVTLGQGEAVPDQFSGVNFTWRFSSRTVNSSPSLRRRGGRRGGFFFEEQSEIKSFELSFHRRHKALALKEYLPFVLERAKAIREGSKELKLYTNQEDNWMPVTLRHPATFATLAMDDGEKRALMDDLARFAARREYYRRIGKAWKRGYLLYGPPGTGKSSLVAAMANYLRFDIYDLELTEVRSNSALRSLLVTTTSRSILVVEDIDCSSSELHSRESHEAAAAAAAAAATSARKKRGDDPNSDEGKVTLSGLLNFVDGLWSSCGEERIIVFTTNHKDRLDPALLRPGRMDMHIHMGYCGPTAFRVLVGNYHEGATDHPPVTEAEALLAEVEATPAEVAEELMRSEDAEVALGGVLELLRRKKKAMEEEAAAAAAATPEAKAGEGCTERGTAAEKAGQDGGEEGSDGFQ